MDAGRYLDLKTIVQSAGYGDEITWAENIQPCSSADDFALEHAFVVCNSGMKAQIARPIFENVKQLLGAGVSSSLGFGHVQKTAAIDRVWILRDEFFRAWKALERMQPLTAQLEWLQTLPWIGPITRYHLAKNLGVDCCKPDRHLVRIAAELDEAPAQMCARLSRITGDQVRVVDTVLWRAANLRMA